MGIVASRHLSGDKLQQIQAESGFSPLRIDYLMGQYQSLERDAAGQVLRSELLKVPPVAAHPLADRLVDVYLHPSPDFRHFVHGLARFQRSVPLQHKLESLLSMYDDDGDGLLSAKQCNELISQLPATRRELRSMRWKLKRLLAAQASELVQAETPTLHELELEEEQNKEGPVQEQAIQLELDVALDHDQGFINCDDLAYITREVDLDQSLSLRFNS